MGLAVEALPGPGHPSRAGPRSPATPGRGAGPARRRASCAGLCGRRGWCRYSPARSTVRTATIRAVRAAEADHGAVQPGCTGPTQVANTSPICWQGTAGRWSTPTAGAHRRCSAARPELAGAATVCPVCGSRRTRCRTRPAVPLPGGTGRHMSRNPVSARATRSATESVYGIGASSRFNVCWSTPGTCLVSGLFRVGSCPIP